MFLCKDCSGVSTEWEYHQRGLREKNKKNWPKTASELQNPHFLRGWLKLSQASSQTHRRANLCLYTPPSPPPPHSPSLRLISVFDWRSDWVFVFFHRIQYVRAGSEWATGVGDNTYRRWILHRPGRRAQSRAQPHMGTLPWLSCRWHWKMKAISELAELWRGLLHSSIWALGLFVHSLTSLKQQKWARAGK